MAFSLYHATVGAYLQILPGMTGILAKAEAHCAEKGLADEALTGVSLAPDMWPFAKQVAITAFHSAGAIKGLRAGLISPDLTPPPTDLAGLKQRIADAISFLESLDPAEVDGFAGRDMRFSFGERHMDFTAEDFLLTFALPNFYFHAATAYDVLRHLGLPVGKMDFLGKPRLKG
jgi:uncharacterized protein